jgi:hypothetical protein
VVGYGKNQRKGVCHHEDTLKSTTLTAKKQGTIQNSLKKQIEIALRTRNITQNTEHSKTPATDI